MDDARATEGTPLASLETAMNHLRDEVTDAIIELVYCSFPGLSEQQFRSVVYKVLCVVDYAVVEVLKNERHVRYLKNLHRSKN